VDGYESISRDFPLPQYSISIVTRTNETSRKRSRNATICSWKTSILWWPQLYVEVGVNVPNKCNGYRESTERFWTFTVHQLRGRVGRGAEQSYCILIG
jgi:ATP-dependent DNA helicase RecG